MSLIGWYSGLELLEEDARRADIRGLKLADRFINMDKGDLECNIPRLALKRAYFSDLWRVTSVLSSNSRHSTINY